jgi:hypothetical protein
MMNDCEAYIQAQIWKTVHTHLYETAHSVRHINNYS